MSSTELAKTVKWQMIHCADPILRPRTHLRPGPAPRRIQVPLEGQNQPDVRMQPSRYVHGQHNLVSGQETSVLVLHWSATSRVDSRVPYSIHSIRRREARSRSFSRRLEEWPSKFW